MRLRQGLFRECVRWRRRSVLDAAGSPARRPASLAHAYYLLDLAYTSLGGPGPAVGEMALPIYEELGDLVGQAQP